MSSSCLLSVGFAYFFLATKMHFQAMDSTPAEEAKQHVRGDDAGASKLQGRDDRGRDDFSTEDKVTEHEARHKTNVPLQPPPLRLV